MARFDRLAEQYFSDSGVLLDGCKLYFYEPGTTTDKTVYHEKALTTPHAQPVLIGADGRIPDIWYDGEARVVLDDKNDVQIQVKDPIGEPAEDSGIGDWSSAATYDISDLVKGSDDNYYLSVQNANTGNDPTGPSPSWWMEAEFISVYNANFAYSVGNIAAHDGKLWRSLQSPNTGNTPAAGSAFWRDLTQTTQLDLTPKTANFNAADGMTYLLNTSGGTPFTATFPTPSVGARVGFIDYADTWRTTSPIAGRNATENVQGLSEDMTLDVSSVHIEFEYIDATQGWKLVKL